MLILEFAAGLHPGDYFLARVGFDFSEGEFGLHAGGIQILTIINYHMDSKQLQQLLQASDRMSETLLQLREKVVNRTISKHVSSPSEWLLEASQARQVFRTLAETLEANRNLVHLNKEKIEKSRIFLQGLEYYKSQKTLRSRISDYHIEVDPVDDYLDKPLGEVDWERNFEEGEQRLKDSLDTIKANNEVYRQRIIKKEELSKTIDQRKKLFRETIPRQVKNLNEQVLETSKLFGIEANESLESIESSKIAFIYDAMKTMKKSHNITVAYTKSEYESVEIVFKPTGLDLYAVAEKNKIAIEEKEFKLQIVDISPHFQRLVIGVNRRCDFSTQNILTRLVNGEQTKALFKFPNSEAQRNLNNKYVYLEWLEDVLCSSVGEGASFLSIVRERVFALNLVKHVMENLKKKAFYFPVESTAESENSLNLKKLNIEKVQQISFKEYQQFISIPPIITKTINRLEVAERELEAKKKNSKMSEEFNDRYRIDAEKVKVAALLQNYHLTELLIPNLNRYFHISFSYYEASVQLVMLVPNDYPSKIPEVKVLSFTRKTNQRSTMPSLPCKGTSKAMLSFTEEAERVEKEGNRMVSYPSIKGKYEKHFSLLLQVNRILTLVGHMEMLHHQASKKYD